MDYAEPLLGLGVSTEPTEPAMWRGANPKACNALEVLCGEGDPVVYLLNDFQIGTGQFSGAGLTLCF